MSVTQPVTEECINVFSKAVKLNPTHLDAWNSLGECLVHLKRFSEAKYCFLASLKHVINNMLSIECGFKFPIQQQQIVFNGAIAFDAIF